MANYWSNLDIPDELKLALSECKEVIIPKSREELINLSLGGGKNRFEVGYGVEKFGYIAEADVVRCKNGIVVNYVDPYMRRRDPDCMLVNNISKSDKTDFEEKIWLFI